MSIWSRARASNARLNDGVQPEPLMAVIWLEDAILTKAEQFLCLWRQRFQQRRRRSREQAGVLVGEGYFVLKVWRMCEHISSNLDVWWQTKRSRGQETDSWSYSYWREPCLLPLIHFSESSPEVERSFKCTLLLDFCCYLRVKLSSPRLKIL